MPPVSDDIKRIYASAPQDAYMVETFEFSHSQFSQTWYINGDRADWEFKIDSVSNPPVTFLACPFKVKLPTNNTEGGQQLQIVFANMGDPFISEIEAAILLPTEPIEAIYRVYLNVPLTIQQNNPPLTMQITNVSIDNTFITAEATRFDILNNRFPTVLYTTDQFPGLLR